MRNRLRSLLRRLTGKSTRFDEVPELRFALNEISEIRQQLRMLLAESAEFRAQINQTYDSFDTQWQFLPAGQQLLGSETFDRECTSLLAEYSGMPVDWFSGKAVLDGGAGNGRWSYTLAKLGAHVTAVDQSKSGIADVRRACGSFESFKALQHNILEPLPLSDQFDAVWSFGVVHHTGNTRLALYNICQVLKRGGYLFAMIYGEPRAGRRGEFVEINSYVELRRLLSGMSSKERIDYLRSRFPEDQLNAWFDGLSPKINDLHRFDEIREWLREWNFSDVIRTYENRNIFVRAKRN